MRLSVKSFYSRFQFLRKFKFRIEHLFKFEFVDTEQQNKLKKTEPQLKANFAKVCNTLKKLIIVNSILNHFQIKSRLSGEYVPLHETRC